MFKEFIICVFIVIAIIFGDVITQDYTKEVVSNLSDSLSNLRNDVMEQNVDNQKIKSGVENVAKQWEEKRNKLSYYLEHNELEKIETEFTAIKSDSETTDYQQLVESIDKSIFLLKHIEDRYAFNLENIL